MDEAELTPEEEIAAVQHGMDLDFEDAETERGIDAMLTLDEDADFAAAMAHNNAICDRAV